MDGYESLSELEYKESLPTNEQINSQLEEWVSELFKDMDFCEQVKDEINRANNSITRFDVHTYYGEIQKVGECRKHLPKKRSIRNRDKVHIYIDVDLICQRRFIGECIISSDENLGAVEFDDSDIVFFPGVTDFLSSLGYYSINHEGIPHSQYITIKFITTECQRYLKTIVEHLRKTIGLQSRQSPDDHEVSGARKIFLIDTCNLRGSFLIERHNFQFLKSEHLETYQRDIINIGSQWCKDDSFRSTTLKELAYHTIESVYKKTRLSNVLLYQNKEVKSQ